MVEPRASPRSSQVASPAGAAPRSALEQRAAALGRRAVGAHALEALQRRLGRDLRVRGGQRLVAARRRRPARGRGPRGRRSAAGRRRGRGDALRAEPSGPEVERVGRADAPDDAVHHPGARAARDGARVLEEGQLGAGMALLVGVEQVVDGRVVLVDRLGHQAQPEHARVEVDVAGGVAGDRGDVVDAVEAHGAPRLAGRTHPWSVRRRPGRRPVADGRPERRSAAERRAPRAARRAPRDRPPRRAAARRPSPRPCGAG